MPDPAFLISCEHAVNHVPGPWRHLFAGHEDILETHRAFDPGAAELAHTLADFLSAPCFKAEMTRLLIDHNRSPKNRHRWSEFSRELAEKEKKRLLDDYYQPYRSAVGGWLAGQRKKGSTVVHISVHSFTPVLKGRTRQADIGLLYDPGRGSERTFAHSWKKRLEELAPDLRVRRNYPYRGSSDCHQTTYRRIYDDRVYLAFELEVNQALVNSPEEQWKRVQDLLARSLSDRLM